MLSKEREFLSIVFLGIAIMTIAMSITKLKERVRMLEHRVTAFEQICPPVQTSALR